MAASSYCSRHQLLSKLLDRVQQAWTDRPSLAFLTAGSILMQMLEMQVTCPIGLADQKPCSSKQAAACPVNLPAFTLVQRQKLCPTFPKPHSMQQQRRAWDVKTRLGSSWLVSRLAKRSFCRKPALSSKPSFASAATNLPSAVSANGFTCTHGTCLIPSCC